MRLFVVLGILVLLVAAAPTASADICFGDSGYNGLHVSTNGGIIVYFPDGQGGGYYIAYTAQCP